MAAPLTKPPCWAYEQELRLIKQQGNQRVDIPADAFKEVLLGARMAPERADEIVRTLRSHGSTVRFAQMRFLSEGFGVKPECYPYSASRRSNRSLIAQGSPSSNRQCQRILDELINRAARRLR